MNVTQLGRMCGLSRSTLLYYESIGLMKRPARSRANYRRYTDADLQLLRQVCLFRNAGLKLDDIRRLLERPSSDASSVLKRRLAELDAEIEQIRSHQKAIVRLLGQGSILRSTAMITKDKWVSIMKAAGFSEKDMHRWHAEFEKSAPEEHQEFLEFLHIAPDEIRAIRDWSAKGTK